MARRAYGNRRAGGMALIRRMIKMDRLFSSFQPRGLFTFQGRHEYTNRVTEEYVESSGNYRHCG